MQDFLRRTTYEILINMKCYTYIYGRTLKIDFREICSPEKKLAQNTVKLIKELINTDVVSNGDIKRHRYLFVREREQVLFGIGFCHQQHLEEDLWTDLTKKRGLRSFVGIVIDKSDFDELDAIPINIDFFIDLYLKNIHRVWNLDDRPKNREVIISDLSEFYQSENWCKLDGNVEFNTNDNFCRCFNSKEEDAVLHSLKKCFSSVAIGLNVESHVISAFRRFNVVIPNAICLETQDKHDIQLIPNQQGCEPRSQYSESHMRPLQHRPNKSIETSSDERGTTNRERRNPAILSDLRKYDSSDDVVKDTLQDNEPDRLMSIDWGDDNSSESHVHPQATANEDRVTITETKFGDLKAPSDTSIDINEEELYVDKMPKKAFRPKLLMILLIAIVVAILLLLKRCN